MNTGDYQNVGLNFVSILVDNIPTVTVNEQDPVFPAASVDEHVTVVVSPTWKTVSDAGTHVTSIVSSILSVTPGFGQVTWVTLVSIFAGHDTVGGSVSVSKSII